MNQCLLSSWLTSEDKLKEVLRLCFLLSLPKVPKLLFLPHQPFLTSYALWFSERKSSSPSEKTSMSGWAQILDLGGVRGHFLR